MPNSTSSVAGRHRRYRRLAGGLTALGLAFGAVAATAPVAVAAPASAAETTATTTVRLNVRADASVQSRRLGVLRRGETVQLTGQTRDGFSEIRRNGGVAWVATRYLRLPAGASAAAPAAAPDAAPAASQNASRWRPEVGASFHIQYTGRVNLNLPVAVYNLDAETTTKAQVDQLKARGVRTICYINAGAHENWRSDRGKFPSRVLGRALDGWPGERWLDIRQRDVLVPIMAARMDLCASKGFDAIDPDNTDGWQQSTGFAIGAADQIAYQRALADEAHKRGLAIGVKNNIEQIGQIGSFVDFAVNEQCGEYNECGAYRAFLASGKPVFNVEYSARGRGGKPAGMSTLMTDLNLSGKRG